MTAQSQHVLIYTTWPDAESAAAAGEELVSRRLAACVNILAPATSIYQWQGSIERAQETPMLVKTVRRRIDSVIARIRTLHPYDVPAVVVLSIEGGNSDFLAWLSTETTDATDAKSGGGHA
ncbi:MAG: divalent-cation tolerance protein CutA [Alphaproteobacteria bacterium]|nr:divalent-cation tolerance protein CutA [Alphaproteobacteria bacterium]